ncbi:penicillin-binding protein 2 [Candidatus Margulisiibacteriota bacterium]
MIKKIFIFVFILLFLRLLQLQLAEHDKFAELSRDNAAKTVREHAPRGIIYDRFDKVMVENRPVFSVHVLPYVLSKKSQSERNIILGLLGDLLGEQIEFKPSATEPIIVKDNIPLTTAIRVEENKRELPGVVVSSRPIRLAKHGSAASHVLGYVGEIEAKELKKLGREGYRLGDFVGKDGVERIYDKYLRGRDGGKKIEVDVYGAPLRILESVEPVSGADVKLTIDLSLQLAVEELLAGREGAVVVLEAKSGKILALASNPNYDPNLFTDPFQNWQWQELKRQKHPFMNRALAIYPPGSIFKVITLAAALEEGAASPDEVMNCNGYYRVNNRYAKCWLEGGHGPITVREGLVWSCDIVFYELGKRLGPDKLAKYAEKFGLGSYTGIDLPQEKKGTIPTKRWKEKYLKEAWYPGDSINYGIGQGFVETTPLQMALVYAGLATEKIYQPFIVQEIGDKQGKIIYQGESRKIKDIKLSKETLTVIKEALKEVVNRGTGVAVRFSGVPAAGKTGTAENPGKAHAWFIGYAPLDDPEIVIATFIAHGEHGDRVSARVTRDILSWYKEYRFTQTFEVEPYEGQYILQGDVKVPYSRWLPVPEPLPEPTSEASFIL